MAGKFVKTGTSCLKWKTSVKPIRIEKRAGRNVKIGKMSGRLFRVRKCWEKPFESKMEGKPVETKKGGKAFENKNARKKILITN